MVSVIFFGADKYSKIVLEALHRSSRFDLEQIITTSEAEIVKQFCREKNLPVTEWSTSMIHIIEVIKKLKPRVGVLGSFGKIIPKKIISLFPDGILNLHPSLLPKYRGPTPVPMAILNGEKETGVTIIKIDERVDHGPIVSQFRLSIDPKDTAESLLIKAFTAGVETLIAILPAYLDGRIELREQDHSQATFTKKLTRDDGKIDWKKPDVYLERFIRAMYPWPGAWMEITIPDRKAKPIRDRQQIAGQAKRLKILKAHLENDKLVLDQVQLEGKKPVSWKQFQEGYPGAEIIRS